MQETLLMLRVNDCWTFEVNFEPTGQMCCLSGGTRGETQGETLGAVGPSPPVKIKQDTALITGGII